MQSQIDFSERALTASNAQSVERSSSTKQRGKGGKRSKRISPREYQENLEASMSSCNPATVMIATLLSVDAREKSSQSRTAMERAARAIVCGSAGVDATRSFVLGVDADACRDGDGCVRARSAVGSATAEHGPLNAVPRMPQSLMIKSPMHLSSAVFSAVDFATAIADGVDWVEMRDTVMSRSGAFGLSGVAVSTAELRKGENIQGGVCAAIEVERSVVAEMITAELGARLTKSKRGVQDAVATGLGLGTGRRHFGLLTARKLLEKVQIALGDEVDILRLELTGEELSSWRVSKTFFGPIDEILGETSTRVEPSNAGDGDLVSRGIGWLRNRGAVTVVLAWVDRALDVSPVQGASMIDVARAESWAWSHVLAMSLRAIAVGKAVDKAVELDPNLKLNGSSVEKLEEKLWKQVSTGSWPKLHSTLSSAILPVSIRQLTHEARVIVEQKSVDKGALFGWKGNETGGVTEISPAVTSSFRGEVLVWKAPVSAGGLEVMAVTADFAQRWICDVMHPIADIVIGGRKPETDDDESHSADFLEPSCGLNADAFKLQSAVSDIASSLSLTIYVADGVDSEKSRRVVIPVF